MKADCGEAGLISLILRQQQQSTHAVSTHKRKQLTGFPAPQRTSPTNRTQCIVPGRQSSFKMAPVASQQWQQQQSTHAVSTHRGKRLTGFPAQQRTSPTNRTQWIDCIVQGRQSSFKMAPVASQQWQKQQLHTPTPVAATHSAAHPHSVDRLYRTYHPLKSGFRPCPSFLNKKAAFFRKKFPHLHAT
jgi:hypothetical protein